MSCLVAKVCRKLLAAMAVVLLAACSPADEVTVLKLAHTLDTGHSVHQAMVYMDQQLREYSGDTMRIDIYPGGQLGSERETIELMQIGSLAMGKVSTSPLEGFVPAMKVFSIPYIFRDREHYWKVLESQVGRDLLLATEPARLRGLAYYDAGSRSFYTTDAPVEHPRDLVGKKIRVQKSKTSVLMVEALGGGATPISWGELYTALQQGVVDGAENNPPSFYLSRHYEISKYYSLDEHTSVPDILLISHRVWRSLSEQQQQWLDRAVADSVAYQRELWAKATEDALAAVQAAGVTVIYPDKTPFREAVAAMQESYRGTEIGDVLEAIHNIR